MGLYIYPDATEDDPFSQDGDMTNPLRHSFDSRKTSIEETRYYLRNDSVLYTYSGVQIEPVDRGNKPITDGTDGYSWKMKAGYDQPTPEEWDTIEAGTAIITSGLEDISTFLPFWLRIEVPLGAEVESLDDVELLITATQAVV